MRTSGFLTLLVLAALAGCARNRMLTLQEQMTILHQRQDELVDAVAYSQLKIKEEMDSIRHVCGCEKGK